MKMLPHELVAWSPYFQDQAAQCRGRAQNARSARERELMVSLRRAWLHVERTWRWTASVDAFLRGLREAPDAGFLEEATPRPFASDGSRTSERPARRAQPEGRVYYFNLVAEAYVVDDVGTALSDMAAVRRHAYAVAQELLRNNPASNAGEWRLEITDGHGGHLLTVAFSEAVQAQRGRYQESRRGKSDRAA